MDKISEPALLLNTTGAAKFIGVSRTKFYDVIAHHNIPSVEVGKSRYFRRRDLEAFVESLGSPARAARRGAAMRAAA